MSTGEIVFVPNFLSFLKSGCSTAAGPSVLHAVSEPGFSSFDFDRREAVEHRQANLSKWDAKEFDVGMGWLPASTH
jgi:hypothetical protein